MNDNITEIYATGTQGAGTTTLLGRILYGCGSIDENTRKVLESAKKDEMYEGLPWAEAVPCFIEQGWPMQLQTRRGKVVRLYTEKSPEILHTQKVESCTIGILVVPPDVTHPSKSEDMENQLCMFECVTSLIIIINKMDQVNWKQLFFVEACEHVRIVLTQYLENFENLKVVHFIPASVLEDTDFCEGVFNVGDGTDRWRCEGLMHSWLRVPETIRQVPEIPVVMNPREPLIDVLDYDLESIEKQDQMEHDYDAMMDEMNEREAQVLELQATWKEKKTQLAELMELIEKHKS